MARGRQAGIGVQTHLDLGHCCGARGGCSGILGRIGSLHEQRRRALDEMRVPQEHQPADGLTRERVPWRPLCMSPKVQSNCQPLPRGM
jgi:hypothetical protein